MMDEIVQCCVKDVQVVGIYFLVVFGLSLFSGLMIIGVGIGVEGEVIVWVGEVVGCVVSDLVVQRVVLCNVNLQMCLNEVQCQYWLFEVVC